MHAALAVGIPPLVAYSQGGIRNAPIAWERDGQNAAWLTATCLPGGELSFSLSSENVATATFAVGSTAVGGTACSSEATALRAGKTITFSMVGRSLSCGRSVQSDRYEWSVVVVEDVTVGYVEKTFTSTADIFCQLKPSTSSPEEIDIKHEALSEGSASFNPEIQFR